MIPETKGRDADVIDFQEWQEGAGKKVSSKEVSNEKIPKKEA